MSRLFGLMTKRKRKEQKNGRLRRGASKTGASKTNAPEHPRPAPRRRHVRVAADAARWWWHPGSVPAVRKLRPPCPRGGQLWSSSRRARSRACPPTKPGSRSWMLSSRCHLLARGCRLEAAVAVANQHLETRWLRTGAHLAPRHLHPPRPTRAPCQAQAPTQAPAARARRRWRRRSFFAARTTRQHPPARRHHGRRASVAAVAAAAKRASGEMDERRDGVNLKSNFFYPTTHHSPLT